MIPPPTHDRRKRICLRSTLRARGHSADRVAVLNRQVSTQSNSLLRHLGETAQPDVIGGFAPPMLSWLREQSCGAFRKPRPDRLAQKQRARRAVVSGAEQDSKALAATAFSISRTAPQPVISGSKTWLERALLRTDKNESADRH